MCFHISCLPILSSPHVQNAVCSLSLTLGRFHDSTKSMAVMLYGFQCQVIKVMHLPPGFLGRLALEEVRSLAALRLPSWKGLMEALQATASAELLPHE